MKIGLILLKKLIHHYCSYKCKRAYLRGVKDTLTQLENYLNKEGPNNGFFLKFRELKERNAMSLENCDYNFPEELVE